MKLQRIIPLFSLFIILFGCGPGSGKQAGTASQLCEQLQLIQPDRGFVSEKPAGSWEEGLVTGNGTLGALIPGHVDQEAVYIGHEKLFMPEYPPEKAPDLKKYLPEIRALLLNGQGTEASELGIKAGEEVGIDGMIWTNPAIPACQLEIEKTDEAESGNYARMVNYRTGEAVVAWQNDAHIYHRSMFVSRADDVAVMKISSPTGGKLNFRFRLSQLPAGQEGQEEMKDLISKVTAGTENSTLYFNTEFKKQWDGSLKAYAVVSKLAHSGGELTDSDGWLEVSQAEEITVVTGLDLYYDLPVSREDTDLIIPADLSMDYELLLASHAEIHGEMMDRFEINLDENSDHNMTSEQLIASSSPGQLNNALVEQLMDASRYNIICSTGEIPPSLQGIWGGTWRPAWSGDFTLNGNVPSVISSGLCSNFPEITRAYLNMMLSMQDDFRNNASKLYGYDGIFVPSRVSDNGSVYHFGDYYPHLFWYAGGAWTSFYMYDYWLYTGDVEFLENKVIPFMMEAYEFYEDVLYTDEQGQYLFLPSYSPEIGPEGHHPLAINATMDIAALKQLLRNLIALVNDGWIFTDQVSDWEDMLTKLPEYAIDENGELKEWIWPEFHNDNQHRHASHLYPLFDGVDPDFFKRPELIEAARTAIENRLEYRRGKNGAEMAFGLVQKGMAAANIRDTEHAYECVDWLCNSYWTPAMVSYHDPGEIFNLDISGGLPTVVSYMLIQSEPCKIDLLPALPDQWSSGSVKGALARGGFLIDFSWEDGVPLQAEITSLLGNESYLQYDIRTWDITMEAGESRTIDFQ